MDFYIDFNVPGDKYYKFTVMVSIKQGQLPTQLSYVRAEKYQGILVLKYWLITLFVQS